MRAVGHGDAVNTRKIRAALAWLWARRPVQHRRIDEAVDEIAAVADSRSAAVRARHEKELEDVTAAVNRIIDQNARRAWEFRDRGAYAFYLEMSPHLFGGFLKAEDRRALAAMMGRRLEAEIATARFMDAATHGHETRKWGPFDPVKEGPQL